MSFDSLLLNTCKVQHFASGGTDSYGQPIKVWTVLYDNEPCRHVSGKGREVKIGQEVVIIYDELFLNDITIDEQDRVIIDCVTYEVLSVVFRQDNVGGHHKQCYLERVK